MRLQYIYSVISVMINLPPGNTKNRELTRSWLIRVRFLHPWAAPCDSFPLTSTSLTTMGCSTWLEFCGSQVSCKFAEVKSLPVLTSNVHVCACMRPSLSLVWARCRGAWLQSSICNRLLKVIGIMFRWVLSFDRPVDGCYTAKWLCQGESLQVGRCVYGRLSRICCHIRKLRLYIYVG